MAKPISTPDRLFDRTWRPGHPFRPRISGRRRWCMGTVFFLLCVVIGGYWYITDSVRVGKMAESYLSTLLGGPVKVDEAKLSIFEGLRLNGVHLYADNSQSPESLLFSAKSFDIQYSQKALLTGRIEATSIRAIDPHVHVTEDADTGRRNYSRLLESRPPASMPSGPPGKPLTLPEIVLRNAQVDYSRVREGKVIESSSIAIEGQLKPMADGKIYGFRFQSRGKSAGIGPMVEGSIVMGSRELTARLQNFEFGADVKTMLPPDVRKWWEQHELTGRVDVPVLSWSPGSKPGKPEYRVEIELQGVTIAVHPEEWMGADEHRTLQDMHTAFKVMRTAGLNGRGFIDHVAELIEPTPITLKKVHGRFVFGGDESIQIEGLNGRLEEIPFKISGKIKGYTPAAQAQIRIASSELDDIEIPAAPRYINSMPPAVREIYDRFRPRGICRFWVELNRPEPGARPRVTGDIEIIDGNFTFDRFPYPLRKATGHILITQDPNTGEESLELQRIRGRGIEGGPNANSYVEVAGKIGPFSEDTRVDIIVSGKGVTAEPALMAAFPPMTRKALTIFDAPGKGEFPKFGGDFECNIVRLREIESHWIIDTHIKLKDAAGALVSFPYMMSGVTGDLIIHDDNVELKSISMKRGEAELTIDGTVSWPSGDAPKIRVEDGPLLKPNLTIVARNVPIDDALLDALPESRRQALRKLGVGGKFDLHGTVRPASAAGADPELDMRITLKDASLWPVDGMFAVSHVQGTLGLTNQNITLNDLHGKRGDGTLTAQGQINWTSETPSVAIRATASNLAMDTSLYKLLPDSARTAWDQVRPVGTLDASLTYSGSVASASTTRPSATRPSDSVYEMTLTPRKLSATPTAVPYRLDNLAGTVTVLPNRVMLRGITATHGDAKVKLAGNGITAATTQNWDFSLAGENVVVDDDLRNALPAALAEMARSVALQGKSSFEFTKLRLAVTDSGTDATNATTRGDTTPGSNVDVDFGLNVKLAGASMDIGVPLLDVNGSVDVTGSSRAGKLVVLGGKLDIESLNLAARPVTRLKAELYKGPSQDQLTIGRIEGLIAKGGLAGQIDYAFPDKGPSRYEIRMDLRHADVKELVGETESQDIQGRLDASLALQGVVGQLDSRRGRGDVKIAGDQMYRIPLVLGLLQITNLSLPFAGPFTEASARYIIDGQRVTFGSIEMRSKEMLMQGTGKLDFGSKQVQMTFVTDSTTWPKIPFVGDIIQSARHELLQIHVRGSLQEPKVSARAFNTITTTIDEVVKGDSPPQAKGK